jgi:hypothetical protein
MLAPIKALLIVFKGLSDGHFSCLAFLALRLQTLFRFRSYIKQFYYFGVQKVLKSHLVHIKVQLLSAPR